MKTMTIPFALCSACAITAAAFAGNDKPTCTRTKKVTLAQMYERKFGGALTKPGTGTGVTGFINVGGAAEEKDVDRTVATIGAMLKHRQKVLKADALNGLPTRDTVKKFGLDVGVFVVSNPELPPLLAAPEERWAIVNVAKLKAGLTDDAAGKALYAARCRGEMQRGFCYAAGCGSSQFKHNLMTVSEVGQLDSINADIMVFDAVQRCSQYLKAIGVTPPLLVSYQKACEDGWAPAPTNDVQKTIWDKVHALPTNPIKIKPETKPVKE